jgi:hypothetical protein
MPTLRKPPDEDSDVPKTNFERQRRKMHDDGDGEISDKLPPLPEESPWGKIEPSIN